MKYHDAMSLQATKVNLDMQSLSSNCKQVEEADLGRWEGAPSRSPPLDTPWSRGHWETMTQYHKTILSLVFPKTPDNSVFIFLGIILSLTGYYDEFTGSRILGCVLNVPGR